MTEQWYARPVLFVTDVDRSLDFFVRGLGFTQNWRFEEAGKAFVAQADRQGCALIFSSQWPDKVGKALMFISLDLDAPLQKLSDEVTLSLDRLRVEFASRGVAVRDGWWGYRVLIVTDPDGNELYFNYPDASSDSGRP
jgi:catechol 2,3-dioxygenase-like lactoylglutathione lyase family enzyme